MNVLSTLLCSLPISFALVTTGCSSSTTPKTDLGVTMAGPYSAHVYIEGTGVTAGVGSRMVIVIVGAQPTAMTRWIGLDTAAGSVKKTADFDKADGDWDIDLVTPSPIPAGSKFYFETDTDGKKDVGSLPYSK